MLVFVTSLWVTEAIPYFVTALLIPVLVVLMDIMVTADGEYYDKPCTALCMLLCILFCCISRRAYSNETYNINDNSGPRQNNNGFQ